MKQSLIALMVVWLGIIAVSMSLVLMGHWVSGLILILIALCGTKVHS